MPTDGVNHLPGQTKSQNAVSTPQNGNKPAEPPQTKTTVEPSSAVSSLGWLTAGSSLVGIGSGIIDFGQARIARMELPENDGTPRETHRLRRAETEIRVRQFRGGGRIAFGLAIGALAIKALSDNAHPNVKHTVEPSKTEPSKTDTPQAQQPNPDTPTPEPPVTDTPTLTAEPAKPADETANIDKATTR